MKAQLTSLKAFALLIFCSLLQLTLLAQDNSSSSTTSTSKTSISVTDSTGSNWYTSPWVWVVGAALFILLLVALLSSGGRDRDRVVVKKTVVDKDRDTVVRDTDPDVV